MLRLLSDENFNGEVVRGLMRRLPDLDLRRVQDVGLGGASDPKVLAWAAVEGRILLTHDRKTLPSFAFQRVRSGLDMPGVLVVHSRSPVGPAIDELILVCLASLEAEWRDRVDYLPL